jgi:D-inositol-3-phosphate glycosyltransferase
MRNLSVTEESSATHIEVEGQTLHTTSAKLAVSLLTGCKDKPYVFGLATALASNGVGLDVVGSDEIDSPEMHTAGLRFLNFLAGYRSDNNFTQKLGKILGYYTALIRYAAHSSPKILHILWNSKFEFFDRTIMMFYYKVLGKKIVFTAHNVNQGKRDAKDSWLNRITLSIQYRLCDHIFVHTPKMKEQLCNLFAVPGDVVSIISFPINNSLPNTELTPAAAKLRLGIASDERAILFFGRIRPYKGIEHLLEAFRVLSAKKEKNYRLIVAGEPIKGCEDYLQQLRKSLGDDFDQDRIIWRTQFIPDTEVEIYVKAADVLVLPYKEIFQSGVLFLAYAFGLPVVATDVGSFREDIVEGRTGFLCDPEHPQDMAKAIDRYFASDLFRNLTIRRQEIKNYANAHHSWQSVAGATCSVYSKVLERNSLHTN